MTYIIGYAWQSIAVRSHETKDLQNTQKQKS